MTRDERDAIADEVYEAQKVIFATKGTEYTGGNADALYNFKKIGQEYGVEPELVCSIYLEKHLAAIRYAMQNPVLSEPLLGRIVDACTYLVLLYGLWLEAAEAEELQSEAEWQTFTDGATVQSGGEG
jgi:hypothetical protein